MNKKILIITLLCSVLLSFNLLGFADEDAEKIEWMGANSWPESSIHSVQFNHLIDLIEEKSNGELTISVVGPETWPGAEQLNLLQDGTLDIVTTTTAYYMSMMPDGVLAQFAWGDREKRVEEGLHEFINDAAVNTFNAKFIAEYPVGVLHIFLAEPVESVKDLSGKRLRNPPLYSPGTEALGMTAVMMSDADAIEGLHTGVVDAVITSLATYVDWGYYEAAPYILNPPMGHATGFVFANNNSFNNLPEHLQQVVLDAIEESNVYADEIWQEEQSRIRKLLAEEGVEYIDVPEDEWEYYSVIYRDSYLEKIVEPNLGNEKTEEIRSIFKRLGNPPSSTDYSTTWPPSN